MKRLRFPAALVLVVRSTRAVNGIGLVMTLLLSLNFSAYAYDLFGSDIPGPSGNLLVTTTDECASACNGNSACQAWTFVKPPLKNPTSAPSVNAVCTANAPPPCLSGVKRSDGWCGEGADPAPGVPAQGIVLSCPSGQTCGPRVTIPKPKPWYCFFLPFLDICHQEKTITADLFCQSP
jgi:hypothetical protein